MHTPEMLLVKAKIKKTPARILILKILQRSKNPLSQSDLASNTKIAHLDKVTLYRTLETLRIKKLIYRFLGPNGIWYFCANHVFGISHECGGNHIHFFCTCCEKIFCILDVLLPWIELPKGMQISSKQLLVKGQCDICVVKKGRSVSK